MLNGGCWPIITQQISCRHDKLCMRFRQMLESLAFSSGGGSPSMGALGMTSGRLTTWRLSGEQICGLCCLTRHGVIIYYAFFSTHDPEYRGYPVEEVNTIHVDFMKCHYLNILFAILQLKERCIDHEHFDSLYYHMLMSKAERPIVQNTTCQMHMCMN